MKKDPGGVHLTAGEYLLRARSGLNQQMVSARRLLMVTVRRVVPQFFERLRDDVYPTFARLAEAKPGLRHRGGNFSIWLSRFDRDDEFKPVLMEWARRFHVEGEEWILDGARKTLSGWHRLRSRKELEIDGFRQFVAVPGLIRDHEHAFHFDDDGWDPTVLSFAGWRATVRKGFEVAMKQHGQQMRALIQARDGIAAVRRSSAEHFEWLAHYHFGEASLASIVKRGPYADKTTISKGIHQAAKLAGVRLRTEPRKLKSR
jgi:hypothetical protein